MNVSSVNTQVAALGTNPLAPNGLGDVSAGWQQALDAATAYAQEKGFLGVVSKPVEAMVSFSVGAEPVHANQGQEISLLEKSKKHYLTTLSPNLLSARQIYDTITAAIDKHLEPKAEPVAPPTVERVAPELGKQVAALSTTPMAPNGLGDVTQGYNRALRVASVYAEKQGIQGLTSRAVEGMVSFSVGVEPAPVPVNANEGQDLVGVVNGEEKSLGLIVPNLMSERAVFDQMKSYIDAALR